MIDILEKLKCPNDPKGFEGNDGVWINPGDKMYSTGNPRFVGTFVKLENGYVFFLCIRDRRESQSHIKEKLFSRCKDQSLPHSY